MKNPHYTEKQLEIFARDAASRELPVDVQEHFALCLSCREQYQFFREFRKNLREELAKGNNVDRLMGQWYPNIIRLYPYSANVDFAAMGAEGSVLVLAAQGAVESDARFVAVGTFASESHKVLVRVVEDNQSRTFRIHILSAEQKFQSRTQLVVVESTGQTHYLRTDKDGLAEFAPKARIDWKNVNVVLVA